MINRNILPILISIAALLASGCATTRDTAPPQAALTEPPPEEQSAREEPNLDLSQRIEAIEAQLQAQSTQLAALQELDDKITKMTLKTIILDSRLTDIESRSSPRTSPRTVTDLSKLRVKVLSGDGMLESAHSMADKLQEMGYVVTKTGMAPRSSFRYTKIFYKEAYRAEAEKLAAVLGQGTETKPLTWRSEFNFIVVTGSQL